MLCLYINDPPPHLINLTFLLTSLILVFYLQARKLVMSGADAFPKSAVIKKRQETEEGVDIGENDMMA